MRMQSPRLWRNQTLACFVVFIGTMLVATGQEKGPLPIPARLRIEEGVGAIRKQYADDYESATDVVAKRALGRKLLSEASDQNTPPLIFAALFESRRFAAEVGDAGTALAALAELNSRFRIPDPQLTALILDTLEPLANSSTLSSKDAARIVPLAMVTAGVTLDRQDYNRTARLGRVALKAAERAEDEKLIKDAGGLEKFTAELDRAATKLIDDPDDTNANDTLGVFWALVRAKWEIGLPYLTKSSDPGVKIAAAKDLENPTSARARAAVGDLWNNLSAKEKGDLKQRYAERAWEWYAASLAVDPEEDNPALAKAEAIEDAYPSEFLLKFDGHTNEVNGVNFSPDGKLIASASYDNTVRLWDPLTGKEIRKLAHDGLVWDAAFSADSKKLASIEGYNVRTWDVATGEADLALNHPELIWGVAFSTDGRTLATADSKTLKLWDAVSGKELKTLEGHAGELREVRYFANGRMFASTGSDGVRVWDTSNYKLVRSFPEESATSAIAVSPDGKLIATSRSGLRIWDVETGKELQSMDPGCSTAGVAFGPDGRVLASAHEDKTIRLWDTATGKQLAELGGFSERVNRVAFSPDGKWVIGASKDPVMRRWRVSSVLSRPLANATNE